MGRTFVEVFPDYRVPDQLSYLLSHTEVEQVLMKKKTRELIIRIRGRHILKRSVLNKIAYELKNELFPRTRLFVHIEDRYDLPESYTLRDITSQYWDSILYDMKRRGMV